jgi:hypothetical protein
MKIPITCNFKEENIINEKLVTIGKRYPRRLESNLGSINLDRIIRMLSFFKQIEKWIYFIGHTGHSESPENCDYF